MTSLTSSHKSILIWTAFAAFVGFMLLFPDCAFAQQAGGAIRSKLDSARSSYVLPVAIGIIAVGSIIAVVLWLFDVIDWKGMAKWIFGAMLVGAVAAVVLEVAA